MTIGKPQLLFLSDKLKGENWHSRFHLGREEIVPIECISTGNCETCYVVVDFDGSTTYCGNPALLAIYKEHGRDYDNAYHYRWERQWKTELNLRSVDRTAAKAKVRGDRIIIPAGVILKCKKCSHQWQKNRASNPKVKTGVRCPSCHSRNVVHAVDGSPLVSRNEKKKALTRRVEDPEEKKVMERQVEAERGQARSDGVKVVRPALSANRKEKLKALRREMQSPSEGVDEEIAEVEAKAPVAVGPTLEDELTDLLPEIFDKETFIIAHQAEVDFLVKAWDKETPELPEKLLENMSTKVVLMLRIIFRSPDIDTMIKVLALLYAVNQATLVGYIRGTAPKTEEEE